ncbi:DNA mismatch repair protein Msh3 [Porphyridium purpureum]|uniref:DNA mismatch repair protein n=1 Tax=Porphyridium purpureum TaxID=35688 RepID=A0A5J4Z067_PORPP|nr:DNA mismatch repair protein Msh3 [Porphyridium purpureum]|eukprot:POR8793..scf208_2
MGRGRERSAEPAQHTAKPRQLLISRFFAPAAPAAPAGRAREREETSPVATKQPQQENVVDARGTEEVCERGVRTSSSDLKRQWPILHQSAEPAAAKKPRLEKEVPVDVESTLSTRDPDLRRRFVEKLRDFKPAWEKVAAGETLASLAPQPRSHLKLTPLEEQVEQIRRCNRNTVLVVQVGYKYRLFGADAQLASRVCGLFAYVDHNFLTVSFPVHRVLFYVRKLVLAGARVGIVRQIETPALKKKAAAASCSSASTTFERKLTDLFTRSTMVGLLDEDNVDDQDEAIETGSRPNCSFLVGLYQDEGTGKLGMLAVDSANGDVLYDEFFERSDVVFDQLDARMHALDVVELLLLKDHVTPRLESYVKQYKKLMPHIRVERVDIDFDVQPNLGTAAPFPQTVWPCVEACRKYLCDFQLDRALEYATDFSVFRSSAELRMDRNVISHLDILGHPSSTGGSLLGHMSRGCRTSFGKRCMKFWILKPLVNALHIRARLGRVDAVRNTIRQGSDSRQFQAMHAALAKCPDLERAVVKIHHLKCSPAELVQTLSWLVRLLRLAQKLAKSNELPLDVDQEGDGDANECLMGMALKSSGLIQYLETCLGLLDTEMAMKKRSKGDSSETSPDPAIELKPDQFAQLFRGRAVESISQGMLLKNHHPELSAYFEHVATIDRLHAQGDKCLMQLERVRTAIGKELKRTVDWKKVATEEFLIEIPLRDAPRVPSSWKRINQTKSVVRFRTTETSTAMQALNETREQLGLEAAATWRAFLVLVNAEYVAIRSLVRALGAFDATCALAVVSLTPGYVRPEIFDENSTPAGLQAMQARHPIVEQSMTFVPNDVRLGLALDKTSDACDPRCLIVTGPNMGGKSTYMRMVAMLAIMAQMGSYVPANSMALSPFDAIYARMGATDNIASGRSTFMTEMNDMAHIMHSASERSLLIIDELGRGTATHDGSAIAAASLEYIVQSMQSCCLFVTHYPNVVAQMCRRDVRTCSAMYMAFLQEERESADMPPRITFLYRLTAGIADCSYGLNVARLAGLPEDIVQFAGKKSEELERDVYRRETCAIVETLLLNAEISPTQNHSLSVSPRDVMASQTIGGSES